MDSSEGFCFEVPVFKVEKIEDIHKINATKSSDKNDVANANNTSNPTTAVENNNPTVSNFTSSDECILIKDQNHYSYSNLCSETETAVKSTNVPISSTANEDTCKKSSFLQSCFSNENLQSIIKKNNNNENRPFGKFTVSIEKVNIVSNKEKYNNTSSADETSKDTNHIQSYSYKSNQKDADNSSTFNCKPQKPILIVDDEDTNEQITKKKSQIPKTLDQTSNKPVLDLQDKCPAESSPVVIYVHKHKKPNKAHPNSVFADTNNQTNIHTERHVNEPISIIIDEDIDKDNDCTIIENNVNSSQSHRKDVHCFQEIYKANRLLSDIIEKCLDMENSAGMLRVINRTLIPMFIDADDVYKKSFPFKKCLTQTIRKIDREPEKKFSHIRDLCQRLKYNKNKKRVSFKTLDNKLNGRFSKYRTQFSPEEIPSKRKKVDTIIDLDIENDEVLIDCSNDTDLQIQITNVRGHVTEEDLTSGHKVNSNKTNVEINGNNNQLSDTSIVPNKERDDDVILVDNEDSCDKENDNVVQIVNKELLSNKAVNNEVMAIDLSNEPDDIDSNIVSKPRVMPKPLIHKEQGGSSKEIQIRSLEEDIAHFNKLILELEEQEVNSDEEWNSPYILSENYKAKVVYLYKKLCTLTGTESVKQHKVRLMVADGHPAGPVRCLEEYINNNIDKDGNPPFPDMHDVINCVNRANELHNMRWSKKQVEREARALFIQYGRTVQKRRMKREWQHLMTYVKEEVPDPADDDLMLQARLQENTKIAKKNEDELLERYAQMEKRSSIPNPDSILNLDSSDSNQDSNDIAYSDLPSCSNVQNEPISERNPNSNIRLNSYEQSCSDLPIGSNVQNEPISERNSNSNIRLNSYEQGCSDLPIGSNVQTEPISERNPNSNIRLNSYEQGCSDLPSGSNVQTEPISERNLNSNRRLNSYEQGCHGNVTNNVLIFPLTIPVQYAVTPYVIGYVNPISQPTAMVLSTDIASTTGQTEVTMNHENTLESSATISEFNSQLGNNPVTVGNVVNYMATNLDTSKNKNNIETENCEVTSTSECCESNINHIELNAEKNTDNSKLSLDNKTCELESGEAAKSQADANNVIEALIDKACEHENTDTGKPQKEEEIKLVKREPLDIPRMLEELGDDFTTTILDIEDPFLVIEISDSSCSEDEES